MYKIIGGDRITYGPVPAATLRQWQAEGRVHGGTMVQFQDGAWRPLSSFPEFAVPPAVSRPAFSAAPRPSDSMAVAGIVCGVLANICCCFPVLVALLGIVFSVIALSRQDRHPDDGGAGLAVVGLVLSLFAFGWHMLLPLYVLSNPGHWKVFHYLN